MLHIVAPGLLDNPPQITAKDQLTRFPQLETLLTKGSKQTAQDNYVTTMLELYGVPYAADHDLPTAAICYHAEADQSLANTYLLHADPIHLKPDQDRLLAFDFHQQPLTMREAEQVAVAFNQHFAEDGLQLLIPDPNHWYVSVQQIPNLQTKPLIDVIGRNIDLFLPQGSDAPQWLSWMNEIQMLLHSLPVNQQRENYGQMAINGLWFSGGGKLPIEVKSGFAKIEGDCVLVRGLQKLTKTESADQLMLEHAIGRASINNDNLSWINALHQFNVKLGQYMLREELILYPCKGNAWYWHPKMHRKWWLRKKSLSAFINGF